MPHACQPTANYLASCGGYLACVARDKNSFRLLTHIRRLGRRAVEWPNWRSWYTGWLQKVSHFRIFVRSHWKPVDETRIFSQIRVQKSTTHNHLVLNILYATKFATPSITLFEAAMWVKCRLSQKNWTGKCGQILTNLRIFFTVRNIMKWVKYII